MKLISFDVGIKNMAYCILEHTRNEVLIDKWGVLNFTDNDNVTYNCDCKNKPKNKKTPPTNCNKKAKYYKNDKYYCPKNSQQTDGHKPLYRSFY